MDTLEHARAAIDEIDFQMAILFEKRMRASATIAAYKKQKGLALRDEAREAALLEKNCKCLQDPSLRGLYTRYFRHLLSLSREHQAKLMQGELE